MFNKKLKVPSKSFDNFYSLLVREGESGVEKESTKVRNSISKFKSFLKEVKNEVNPFPLGNPRYYKNDGFSTSLKISSDEGLKLSFIVDDAIKALSVCKDTIDKLNSDIDYKDGVIESLENENNELSEKYDLIYDMLNGALEREKYLKNELNNLENENANFMATQRKEIEELQQEKQELHEEVLRLRYFAPIHKQ